MKVVVDENCDYYNEAQLFYIVTDKLREEWGLPKRTHKNIRYIQGKILDTDTGITSFVFAPLPDSDDWKLLITCWWNKNARGMPKEGEAKCLPNPCKPPPEVISSSSSCQGGQ